MASPPSIPEARAPAEFGGGGLASLPSWRRVVMAGRRTVTAVARVSSAELANWRTKVAVVYCRRCHRNCRPWCVRGSGPSRKGGGACTGPVYREGDCPHHQNLTLTVGIGRRA